MDRIDKLLLIGDQIKELQDLKNKLSVKLVNNQKSGIKFVQLKSLEFMMENKMVNIKNSEGRTLSQALEKVNELFQRTLIEFEYPIGKEINKMYENKKKMMFLNTSEVN